MPLEVVCGKNVSASPDDEHLKAVYSAKEFFVAFEDLSLFLWVRVCCVCKLLVGCQSFGYRCAVQFCLKDVEATVCYRHVTLMGPNEPYWLS